MTTSARSRRAAPEGAWTRWAGAPAALAAHLVDLHEALAVAVLYVRAADDTELDRRQSRWRPVAERARGWLVEARLAHASSLRTDRVRQAETWLARCAREIELERFAPIEGQMLALWEQLRLESSVRLGDVALAGTSTHRRVTLDVTVDDSEANALGVMSRGELHALALAIFLPRATLAESPFRFVIMDHPVQSMDLRASTVSRECSSMCPETGR